MTDIKEIVRQYKGECKDIIEALECEDYYADGNDALYNNGALWDYNYNMGATKIVIPYGNKIVFKTSIRGEVNFEEDEGSYDDYEEPLFLNYSNDYSKKEYEVYLKAKKKGLDKFFVPIEKINNKVYAQEYCSNILSDLTCTDEISISKRLYQNRDYYECYPDNDEGRFTRPIVKDLKKLKLEGLLKYFIGYKTIYAFLQDYTIDEMTKLLSFLEENNINDLNTSNVGYYEENGDWKIKIFDYSGFDSYNV